MKWFKHDSDASNDAKLRKLRHKYGTDGYAVYWYCLELVARNVDKHNLTFELEHDAELIADDFKLSRELVEEMMKYMVILRLFEDTEGVITCLKMRTRTDEYTQKLINKSRIVPTLSRQSPRKSELIEEKRTEEKKKNRRFTPPSLDEINKYVQEKGYRVNAEDFVNFYQSKNWMVGKNKMSCWKSATATWHRRNSNGTEDQLKGMI